MTHLHLLYSMATGDNLQRNLISCCPMQSFSSSEEMEANDNEARAHNYQFQQIIVCFQPSGKKSSREKEWHLSFKPVRFTGSTSQPIFIPFLIFTSSKRHLKSPITSSNTDTDRHVVERSPRRKMLLCYMLHFTVVGAMTGQRFQFSLLFPQYMERRIL